MKAAFRILDIIPGGVKGKKLFWARFVQIWTKPIYTPYNFCSKKNRFTFMKAVVVYWVWGLTKSTVVLVPRGVNVQKIVRSVNPKKLRRNFSNNCSGQRAYGHISNCLGRNLFHSRRVCYLLWRYARYGCCLRVQWLNFDQIQPNFVDLRCFSFANKGRERSIKCLFPYLGELEHHCVDWP